MTTIDPFPTANSPAIILPSALVPAGVSAAPPPAPVVQSVATGFTAGAPLAGGVMTIP